MANTYTQIHIQIIFAVKYRKAMINPDWKDDLFKYIAGIIKKQGHKLLIINGVADHIHILIGYRPLNFPGRKVMGLFPIVIRIYKKL